MNTLFTDVYVYDEDSQSGMHGPTDVAVVDNRISVIGSRARRAHDDGGRDGTADTQTISGGSRHLLAPGLINAHFHSPANHLKGSFPSMPLEIFMLYESPTDPALAPSPRAAYLRTMLAALEMLRTGTTAVQDDAFLMPHPTPEIIDAVMQAYADSGLRASVALDQPNLPESEKLPYIERGASRALRAHLDAPAPMGSDGLLEMYTHLISRWHGAADGRLTAATSVSAPQRVTTAYFEALDDLSRAHRIPLFAHMLETKAQRALATEQPRFAGRSLVEYTADLGLLSERMNVIHAVWVDDHDLDLIATAGAVIAHNPVSNLRLGSGVAPYRRFMDFGIPTCLGTDEAICDDTANMWGVVKATGLIHNISGMDSDRWPVPREVLNSLWRGGAAALMQPHQLGSVKEGFLADLTLLDLHSPAFTPFNDLRGQLVYCESGSSVRLTMVDGQIVFHQGRVTSVDETALLDEAREIFARPRPDAHTGAVLPHYQAMVRRAAAADVGMNRWIGRS